jgi:hypothetical protein
MPENTDIMTEATDLAYDTLFDLLQEREVFKKKFNNFPLEDPLDRLAADSFMLDLNDRINIVTKALALITTKR